jgi:ribosome maturation protein Sdo1
MPFFSANISPLQILRKGVLQVSEKERQAALESSFKEIASVLLDLAL